MTDTTDTEAHEALTPETTPEAYVTRLSKPNAVVHIEVHGLGDGKIDLKVFTSGVHLSDGEVRDVLRSAIFAMDLGHVEQGNTREPAALDVNSE